MRGGLSGCADVNNDTYVSPIVCAPKLVFEHSPTHRVITQNLSTVGEPSQIRYSLFQQAAGKTQMLDWSTLKHAYGNAADVPALLARLSPDPEASVWDELWSRLCHQGTVYSASFAALPVLAEAAELWKPRERAQLLALGSSILASEDVYGGNLVSLVVRKKERDPKWQSVLTARRK